MARTSQVVKHIRSNARTVQNGSIVKAPDSGGLYYGEIGLNSNAIDPTLFLPLVTNTEVTEATSTALITTLAQFKSLGWLQTNVMGTTDPTQIRTLKYITDALDILVADSDAVIDSWNEVKAFLSTLPADDSYTIMSMLGSKASVNYTLGLPVSTTKTSTAMVGNGTTVTATFATATEEPFDVGSYVTVTGAISTGFNGTWLVVGCTLTTVKFVCTQNSTASTQGTIVGSQLETSTKLYDNISLKTTRVPGTDTTQDYSVLYVDLTSGLTAGTWSGSSWTAGSLGTIAQGSNVAIAASQVQGFYNEFRKMFTEQTGPRIQANMDFYSLGEVTAYGTSDGQGGGSGGLIEILNSYIDLSTSLIAFTDDTISGETFNAYTINRIHNRVLTLEAGNSGGVQLTALTTGFSIAGGTTSKTLTVLQTLTLNGTSGATLNIGTGGTLLSGAFAAAYAHPNHTGDVTSTGDGATVIGVGKVTNAMLAGSIAITKLASSTISGVSLGSNLATLTINGGLSGTSYNGSGAVTIALTTAFGDTVNPYASKTANFVLAAPSGAAGVPVFRALVGADIPTLNQSTTGSAATLTTSRSISLTGDGSWTVSFNGSAAVTAAMTLTTVNTNVGSFGGSTAIPVLTVNAKGLVTAVSTAVVIAPAGTLSGTALNAAVVTSSLTSVGTIGTGVWQGTVITPVYGGTGVNNGTKTITLGGNLAFSGAFGVTFIATALTSLTLPTSGTLISTNSTIDCGTF